MTLVKDIDCFLETIWQTSNVGDELYTACQVHYSRMQEKFTEICTELTTSNALLTEAVAKVTILEAEVSTLAELLPESAAALATAEQQLSVALQNQALMQNRVNMCISLQSEFSSFIHVCQDAFNALRTKFGYKLDELKQRLSQARDILEEYLSADFSSDSNALAKHQSQKFEYAKLQYKMGKCSLEDVNKVYIEKIKTKKTRKSQKTEELGVKISEYGLPIFPSEFEVQLDLDQIDKTRQTHFYYVNKTLKDAIEKDENLKSKFSDRQLGQISIGKTPEGYTWHHDGNPPIGRLQLLDSEMHDAIRHDGGYSLWCERKNDE